MHVVAAALFGIGLLLSIMVLYSFPDALERASGKIDLIALGEASSVLSRLYSVVGITLLFAVLAIVKLLYDLNRATKFTNADIVVDKLLQEQKEEVDEKVHESNTTDISKEIILAAENARDEEDRYEIILSKVCLHMEASQGIFYRVVKEKSKRYIQMKASFAFVMPESKTIKYEFGEGLAGQVAKEGRKINIDNIPEGYINIISGLGAASPNHLLIYPLMQDDQVAAVVEIASFKPISEEDERLVAEVLKIEKAKKKVSKAAPSKQREQNDAEKDIPQKKR
jgi:putative methionine-R-sulfoxide reductase with GAF domain